jgi:hypothetical protein
MNKDRPVSLDPRRLLEEEGFNPLERLLSLYREMDVTKDLEELSTRDRLQLTAQQTQILKILVDKVISDQQPDDPLRVLDGQIIIKLSDESEDTP